LATASAVPALSADSAGRVYHANHYLVDHPSVKDTVWLKDSLFRTEQIKELCRLCSPEAPTFEGIEGLYKNEMNFPASINRLCSEGSTASETLFNIVMELKERKTEVTLGRPTSPEDFVTLTF
jgi:isopenicillin-N N-acyltransferase-like protein